MPLAVLLVAVWLAAAIAGGSARADARATAIRVPSGFAVDVWARGLRRPTALAWGPDRRLYVAQEGGVVAAIDPSRRRPRPFARGFRSPLGLVWKRDRLFVSRMGGLESVNLRRGRAVARRTVIAGLPYGRHQQDNVVVGRDGRLYFGSGSTCDVCREHDRRSAAVLSVRTNGRDLRVVARGLRNPFGLVAQPGTERIFVSVNGRDDLGPTEPAEAVVLLRRGAHYGWPNCWPSARRRRLVGACAGVTPPIAYLEPHSAAGGLAFYTGTAFPPAYRGNLFVAEWGEYYSRRHGRKLVRIALDRSGRARGVSVFASGFDHPLAVAEDRAGGLLVADWGRGVIYRIRAVSQP